MLTFSAIRLIQWVHPISYYQAFSSLNLDLYLFFGTLIMLTFLTILKVLGELHE